MSRSHHAAVLREGIELFLSQSPTIHFLRAIKHVPLELLAHSAIGKLFVGGNVVRERQTVLVLLELGHGGHGHAVGGAAVVVVGGALLHHGKIIGGGEGGRGVRVGRVTGGRRLLLLREQVEGTSLLLCILLGLCASVLKPILGTSQLCIKRLS